VSGSIDDPGKSPGPSPQKCGPGNGNARCNESTCHVQMAETSVEPIGSLPR